jgi:hypothetical protein
MVTRFPIGEARKRAKKECLKAFEYIEALIPMDGWEEARIHETKKGKYIELFSALGIYENFKNQYWPKEGVESPYTKRFYVMRALDYDEAVQQKTT